jgi:uncharacterized protein (DUF2225 family)
MKKLIFLILFFGVFCLKLAATTWFPADHVCPVCSKKNTYQEIGSYGSYIYQWSSKYQLIFWPLTDSPSVYCCVDCYFSTYMWDFDSIPSNKIEEIKLILKDVKLDKKYKDYLKIAMTTRLEIAEKVYKVLGRDDEFWCTFYRVMGYHYQAADDQAKAKSARVMALNIAQKLLVNPINEGREIEFLFIKGAMYKYTGEKDSALAYLEKAETYNYSNKNWKEENSQNYTEYLKNTITQYKEMIRKDEDTD